MHLSIPQVELIWNQPPCSLVSLGHASICGIDGENMELKNQILFSMFGSILKGQNGSILKGQKWMGEIQAESIL